MGVTDIVRSLAQGATRAVYARNPDPGAFRVNDPDGFPSAYPPVWWWGKDGPISLAADTPAGLSAVTRATALIVDPVTSVPWRTVRVDEAGWESELPAPRWMSDPCLMRPDDRFGRGVLPAALRLPAKAFWGQWLRSVLWHGMGFLIFEEDAAGAPVAGTMRILNPDHVTPVGSRETGYVHRRIGAPDDENAASSVLTDREGRFVIGPRTYRLLELMNPLDQVDDLGFTRGVIQMHAAELGLAGQAVRYASGTYRSGVPSGFLKVNQPNYTKQQADALRSQWMEHHGGDTRSIAVLGAAIDFTPLQMSLESAQLMESRQMGITDVANMFGVPAYMLNGKTGDTATYSNTESRSVDLRTYTLLPWVTLVEQTLSVLLPGDRQVRIDMRGLGRADTKTRYETYAIGMGIGLQADEWRKLEGLPPLPATAQPDVPDVQDTQDAQDMGGQAA